MLSMTDEKGREYEPYDESLNGQNRLFCRYEEDTNAMSFIICNKSYTRNHLFDIPEEMEYSTAYKLLSRLFYLKGMLQEDKNDIAIVISNNIKQ